MQKTKKKFTAYWDDLLHKRLPPYAKFQKFIDEIREHFSFTSWIFKRAILHIIIFYVIVGLVLGKNFFGSLFVSLLIFLYSNIIPDTDILIKKPPEDGHESLWYEKYLLLLLAPLIVYHIIDGRARPIYSKETRPFHNLKSAAIYTVFLFIIGNVFWDETMKTIMLPVFGGLGFLFHLMVDNGKAEKIRNRNGNNVQASS